MVEKTEHLPIWCIPYRFSRADSGVGTYTHLSLKISLVCPVEVGLIEAAYTYCVHGLALCAIFDISSPSSNIFW